MEPTRDFRLGGTVRTRHRHATLGRHALVRWGDTLVKTIDRGTRSNAQVIVERAGPSQDSAAKPAEAHLRIEQIGRSPEERWLLSESWWAESFPQPTDRELVSWSLRALPWAVALHFARGYWREGAARGRGRHSPGLHSRAARQASGHVPVHTRSHDAYGIGAGPGHPAAAPRLGACDAVCAGPPRWATRSRSWRARSAPP